MHSHRVRAYIYLSIVALIWGIAGPIIKLVLNNLPWDVFLLYRFLISTVVVLPFVTKKRLRVFGNFNTLLLSILYAVSTTTLGLGLLFAGTEKTSLVSMSLISLFGPILVILAGFFILKDKITWTEKIGIGVTFLGSLLIVIEPVILLNGAQGELGGNLLVLGSLIAGVVSAILLKELLRKGVSPFLLANFSFVIGFITMLPITLHFRHVSEAIKFISNMSLPDHLGVWYLALISGILAYSLGNVAQKSIEVSEQAVFGYVYPIISTILAVILLKETVTPLSYFGGGMTIVGIFIAEVKKRTRKSSH